METITKRQRIPAAERKQQMLQAAVELARTKGVNYLTLARVAEASGVSKPVAYQHFGSLSQLLQEMFDLIGGEYEQDIRAAILDQQDVDDDPIQLIALFCQVYIDRSVGEGGLYDEVGASIVSVVEEARSQRVDAAEKYAPFVVDIFHLDYPAAYSLMVAFLGAIDRVCEAVIAGRIQRDSAVDLLMSIFIPALEARQPGGARNPSAPADSKAQ